MYQNTYIQTKSSPFHLHLSTKDFHGNHGA